MTTECVKVGALVTPARDEVLVRVGGTYRNVGILNRSRGLFEKVSLHGDDTKYRTLNRLHLGQVVYSKLFGWDGAIALVGDRHAGAFVSSDFPTFDIDTELVDRPYLGHLLAWEGFVGQMAQATSGLRQRRQRVNPDRFLGLRIPLPPLADQLRIASYLDHIVRLGPTVSGALASLVGLRGRLRSQLIDGLEAPTQRIDQVTTQIKDVVEVQPDGTYSTLGLRNRGRGVFAHQAILGSATKYPRYFRVTPGQLIYSKLFGWEGSVAIVPDGLDGHVVSSEFPTFSIDSDAISRDYLGQVIRSERFTAAMSAGTSGMGQRRQRVNVEQFSAIEIPVPERRVQDEIAACLGNADRAVALADRRSVLADALLPAARNEIFNAML